MRYLLISAALLASAAAYSVATGAKSDAGVGSAGPMQTYDVPTTGKPQTVYILHRVLKPGESIGVHYHPGVEMTQQLSGDLQLWVKGRGNHEYHAGDSWLIPRDTPHDLKNVGSTDGAIAVTYVLDRGAPLRVVHPPVISVPPAM
jgi:quercetin dioxygenase-like cupin family protein